MMRERPQGSFEAPCIAQNGDRSETPVIRRCPKQALVQESPNRMTISVAINSQLLSSVA
jgi:hypothetical protein